MNEEDEEGCTCQECKNKYKMDLIVKDNIWEKIKPKGKEKGAGLLCPECIVKKIEKLSNHDYCACKLQLIYPFF